MLSVTVVGSEELQAKFASMPDKLHRKLLAAVTGLSLQLEAHVKRDKLAGRVLDHITGRLQGSIHSDVEDEPERITGRVYSAGCNYAAIHEYGFQGTENVKEHIRTHLFGREVAPFTVPAHTRSMNMPERSFLRSALADFKDKITQDLSRAANEAFK
jgi:phage gpG-like protein